jgi:hypothetical protein
MALTRSFKKAVVARVERDPAFAKPLLDEAATLFLGSFSIGFATVWHPPRRSTFSFDCGLLTQRKTENASCMSLASARGCSSAAKWPPTGILVHLATLNTRSTHSRGGLIISLGNCA